MRNWIEERKCEEGLEAARIGMRPVGGGEG